MFVLKGYIVVRCRRRCVDKREINIREGFCFVNGDTARRTSGGITGNERKSVIGFFADSLLSKITQDT